MAFQKISSSMKKSKIVNVYIFFWIALLIAFAIGAFLYLNALPNISTAISALIVGLLVVIIIVNFLFRSRFLLFRSFLEGDKLGIKVEIGVMFVILVVVSIFYNNILERIGIGLFIAVLVGALIILVFDFLRLREL